MSRQVVSPGPDRKLDLTTASLEQWKHLPAEQLTQAVLSVTYDPSNGMLSSGDMMRQGQTHPTNWSGDSPQAR